nr:MAG TPA: HTH-type transcriptional regulator [Caudoviricetes sp.]
MTYNHYCGIIAVKMTIVSGDVIISFHSRFIKMFVDIRL